MDPVLPKVQTTASGMGAIVTVTNASEILHDDLSYQWDLVDLRNDVIIIFTTVGVISALLCIKSIVHEGPGPVLLRPPPNFQNGREAELATAVEIANDAEERVSLFSANSGDSAQQAAAGEEDDIDWNFAHPTEPVTGDWREIVFKRCTYRAPPHVSSNAAEPPACGARTLEEKRLQALVHTADWILNSPRERALSLYSGTTPQQAADGVYEIELDELRPTTPYSLSV